MGIGLFAVSSAAFPPRVGRSASAGRPMGTESAPTALCGEAHGRGSGEGPHRSPTSTVPGEKTGESDERLRTGLFGNRLASGASLPARELAGREGASSGRLAVRRYIPQLAARLGSSFRYARVCHGSRRAVAHQLSNAFPVPGTRRRRGGIPAFLSRAGWASCCFATESRRRRNPECRASRRRGGSRVGHAEGG